jgi:hypothetical protein
MKFEIEDYDPAKPSPFHRAVVRFEPRLDPRLSGTLTGWRIVLACGHIVSLLAADSAKAATALKGPLLCLQCRDSAAKEISMKVQNPLQSPAHLGGNGRIHQLRNPPGHKKAPNGRG